MTEIIFFILGMLTGWLHVKVFEGLQWSWAKLQAWRASRVDAAPK